MSADSEGGSVRLDRWLWAARFYKTRSQAIRAIEGGKVHLNGSRVKKSRTVEVGDMVKITKAPWEFAVQVKGLGEKRGPASEARKLYEETEESIAARERLRHQMKAQPVYDFRFEGKPSKKERRELRRFKEEM